MSEANLPSRATDSTLTADSALIIGHPLETDRVQIIGELNQSPIIYHGERCVTAETIERFHGRRTGVVKDTHRRHAPRFVERKHVFSVPQAEYCQLVNESASDTLSNAGRGGYHGSRYLYTRKGYLLLVKVFDDNIAWDIQEELVDGYFRPAVQVDLTPAEQLLVSAHLLVEHERQIAEQRKRLASLEQQQTQTCHEVSRLVQIQQEAMMERTALPVCPLPAAVKPTRAKINEIVRSYCFRTVSDAKSEDFQSAYSKLYREFRDRYHINLVERALNRGGKTNPLDIADELNVTDRLWAVATELYA